MCIPLMYVYANDRSIDRKNSRINSKHILESWCYVANVWDRDTKKFLHIDKITLPDGFYPSSASLTPAANSRKLHSDSDSDRFGESYTWRTCCSPRPLQSLNLKSIHAKEVGNSKRSHYITNRGNQRKILVVTLSNPSFTSAIEVCTY